MMNRKDMKVENQEEIEEMIMTNMMIEIKAEENISEADRLLDLQDTKTKDQKGTIRLPKETTLNTLELVLVMPNNTDTDIYFLS